MWWVAVRLTRVRILEQIKRNTVASEAVDSIARVFGDFASGTNPARQGESVSRSFARTFALKENESCKIRSMRVEIEFQYVVPFRHFGTSFENDIKTCHKNLVSR